MWRVCVEPRPVVGLPGQNWTETFIVRPLYTRSPCPGVGRELLWPDGKTVDAVTAGRGTLQVFDGAGPTRASQAPPTLAEGRGQAQATPLASWSMPGGGADSGRSPLPAEALG
jgi:hypothetical protein